MKKKIAIVIACLVPLLLLGAAIEGYLDWQLRGSTPSNPASGYFRIWADNSAQIFKCLTSSGAACHFEANATSSNLGIVQTDGSTISASSGTISCTTATTSQLGCVKPDGSTITISGGVISSTGGGSGALTRLAQTTLGSPAASVTFSAISGSYSNLMLTIAARSATSAALDSLTMAYNSDTTAGHYAGKFASATGTGISVASQSGSQPGAYVGNVAGNTAVANASSSVVIDIVGYAGTTFIKQGYARGSAIDISNTFSSSNIENITIAHAWNSTAAITQIVLTLVSGANFATGSVFTLYGVS